MCIAQFVARIGRIIHKIASAVGVRIDNKAPSTGLIGLNRGALGLKFVAAVTMHDASALHSLRSQLQQVHFLQTSMDLLLKFGLVFLCQRRCFLRWLMVHLIVSSVHLHWHPIGHHVLGHVQDAVELGGFQPHSSGSTSLRWVISPVNFTQFLRSRKADHDGAIFGQCHRRRIFIRLQIVNNTTRQHI